MEKNSQVYVTVSGVVIDNIDFKKNALKELSVATRIGYDKGTTIDEQKYLDENFKWEKEYKRSVIKSSLDVLKGCRNLIAVEPSMCEKDKEATQVVLKKRGYDSDVFFIMLKKEGDSLLDKSKPVQHIADIMTGGVACTGTSLVTTDRDEANIWIVRGGRAFLFNPHAKEDISTLESSKGRPTIQEVKTLRMVPVALDIYKSKK